MFQVHKDILIVGVICFAVFLILTWNYVESLKRTIERQSRAIGNALKDNKLYKDAIIQHQAYAGNEFVTFSGYPVSTLYERSTDKNLFVLISRADLHDVVCDAFKKGHGMRVELNETLLNLSKDLEVEPVVK